MLHSSNTPVRLAESSREDLDAYLEDFPLDYVQFFTAYYPSTDGRSYSAFGLLNYMVRQYNASMSRNERVFDLELAHLVHSSYVRLCKCMIPYFEKQYNVFLTPHHFKGMDGIKIVPFGHSSSNQYEYPNILMNAKPPLLAKH